MASLRDMLAGIGFGDPEKGFTIGTPARYARKKLYGGNKPGLDFGDVLEFGMDPGVLMAAGVGGGALAGRYGGKVLNKLTEALLKTQVTAPERLAGAFGRTIFEGAEEAGQSLAARMGGPEIVERVLGQRASVPTVGELANTSARLAPRQEMTRFGVGPMMQAAEGVSEGQIPINTGILPESSWGARNRAARQVNAYGTSAIHPSSYDMGTAVQAGGRPSAMSTATNVIDLRNRDALGRMQNLEAIAAERVARRLGAGNVEAARGMAPASAPDQSYMGVQKPTTAYSPASSVGEYAIPPERASNIAKILSDPEMPAANKIKALKSEKVASSQDLSDVIGIMSDDVGFRGIKSDWVRDEAGKIRLTAAGEKRLDVGMPAPVEKYGLRKQLGGKTEPDMMRTGAEAHRSNPALKEGPAFKTIGDSPAPYPRSKQQIKEITSGNATLRTGEASTLSEMDLQRYVRNAERPAGTQNYTDEEISKLSKELRNAAPEETPAEEFSKKVLSRKELSETIALNSEVDALKQGQKQQSVFRSQKKKSTGYVPPEEGVVQRGTGKRKVRTKKAEQGALTADRIYEKFGFLKEEDQLTRARIVGMMKNKNAKNIVLGMLDEYDHPISTGGISSQSPYTDHKTANLEQRFNKIDSVTQRRQGSLAKDLSNPKSSKISRIEVLLNNPEAAKQALEKYVARRSKSEELKQVYMKNQIAKELSDLLREDPVFAAAGAPQAIRTNEGVMFLDPSSLVAPNVGFSETPRTGLGAILGGMPGLAQRMRQRRREE